MNTYVAIHSDGVIAINCKEVVDSYQEIEFYNIENILYYINLDNGRININDRLNNDEEREVMVLEKTENLKMEILMLLKARAK